MDERDGIDDAIAGHPAAVAGAVDPSGFSAAGACDDEAIERRLRIGDETGALRSHFGADQYDELRALAQQAETQATRGGDRVLILPGIMGSRLGHRHTPAILDDVVWLNPLAIAAGRLDELRMDGAPGAAPIDALGVLLFTYLSLKLRLRLAGFDADFHPYDWRRGMDGLGRDLADRIAREGRPVRIVAHSMGGLVARACLAHDPALLGRVVMLGTPNFGSYAPVQAFRGRNGTVEMVARLDLRHSSAELARVFAGFPGLLEMIPAPRVIGAADMFDPASWPAAGEKPADAALAAARAAQDALPRARAGVDLLLVAGVNQRTVVDARLDGAELVYTISDEGDGTVPLRCCLLPEARTTYYVEGEHGALPGLRAIQRALPSLLSTGETTLLPTAPPARRAANPPVEVRESELAEGTGRRAIDPALAPAADPRRIVAAFALPAPPDTAPSPAPAGTTPPPADAPGHPRDDERPSDTVVFSQGRSFRLEIVLALGSITAADARCYVLGLFKSVAPGGAARAIDAAMDGAVTQFVRRRMFNGNVGEVTILPNGRHPIRASHIAFAGLGAIDGFTAERLEVVGENLVRTFVAGRVDDFATVAFGAASGVDASRAVRGLMRGFVRGLRDADVNRRFRTITICENDPARYEQIWRDVTAMAQLRLFDGIELTVTRATLPEAIAPAPARGAAAERDRVYLIAREGAERLANGDGGGGAPALVASLLTSGASATIMSGRQPDAGAGALDARLAGLDGMTTSAAVEEIGDALAALALAPEIRELLARFADQHLVVVHDAAASRIPWEALRFGGEFPALKGGVSHRYEAANLSVAKWLSRRRLADKLNILVVADPLGDLPAAAREGDRIEAMVKAHPGLTCKTMRGAAARRSEIQECLGSGGFDVVHYAGHAFFDPAEPGRSGIVCADREILSGDALATIGNLPSLMFVNACEAARIRLFDPAGGSATRVDEPPPPRREIARRSIGFAEALLRGGVANFVGTYWPVGDTAAELCATTFYPKLLEGRSINAALLDARKAIRAADSPDWADYVFYGDPDFTLKQG